MATRKQPTLKLSLQAQLATSNVPMAVRFATVLLPTVLVVRQDSVLTSMQRHAHHVALANEMPQIFHHLVRAPVAQTVVMHLAASAEPRLPSASPV